MTENPFESPKSVKKSIQISGEEFDGRFFLSKQLDESRRLRKRWNRRCYWIAGACCVLGFLVRTIVEALFSTANAWLPLIRLFAGASLVLAAMVFVLGPLAWLGIGRNLHRNQTDVIESAIYLPDCLFVQKLARDSPGFGSGIQTTLSRMRA